MEKTQQTCVMTVQGGKQPEDFKNYSYILPHEHLVQNLTRYFIGEANAIEQIELKNYSKVKENPYINLSNLALNDMEEICTELKQAFGFSKALIVESTNFEGGRDISKLQQISTRTNIDVIAGYKPVIKGTLFEDEEKNKVFINVDKFGREIQEAIFETTKDPKSGFLGELFLEEELLEKPQSVIFESCIHQSLQFNIPLYIETNRTKNFDLLSRTLDFIAKISGTSNIKLILWNLDLVSSKEIIANQENSYYHVKTVFKNIELIADTIKRGVIVGFDVYSYIDELYELACFVKILVDHNLQGSLLISSGIKFKTHLKKYGGVGYNVIDKFIALLKELKISEGHIEQIFRTNVLELMNWWRPLKVKEVYVKMWNCHNCQKELPESVPKFAKLGHDFCCAKCMREFKYE